MTDDIRARRLWSINEILVRITGERIKTEIGKLIEAGASGDQVDAALAHVIFHWDAWREGMLQQLVDQFDGIDGQPAEVTPLRPGRPN